MKIFLLAAVAVVMITACSKSGSSTLSGRWHVVNDTSITMGGTISYDIYNGNDNDYFDFEANSVLNTKEDGTIKTYTYELKSDDKITITQSDAYVDYIPQSGNYSITGNKAVIFVAPDLTNPGFSYKRVIHLER